jgi:predicted dehydrogenase
MSYQRNRREFIRDSALVGMGVWVGTETAWAQDKSPNEKVNFACIGVGGKGESDSNDAGRLGNVVAICDVDEGTLAKAGQRFPNAKRYTDFRKMLEEMDKSIDAVTVSTPDHCHAVAAATAMKMGKHCFCQKPLTHSIWEARRLQEIAREKKVATQMGNQGTADSGRRKSVAMIQKGVLGNVSEVHVWTNRPIWPQGIPRPAPEPVPDSLHWDLWLGPAAERPYGKGYHTFAWRGWWDFGTGALGDMACHTVNLPYQAVDLRYPISVVAESSGHNKDSYPKSSKIRFEFAGNDNRGPVTLYWYDGGNRCSPDLLDGKPPAESGCLIIGDKGKMYTTGDYGGGGILMGCDPIEVDFVKSPGHFEEFVRACKGGEPAMSNFPDYSGPLTETILLGNLAVWAEGKKIEWDAKNLKAKNAPEVANIIKPEYRKGWDLVG